MEENTPKGIAEFPLTQKTARLILNDLAENFTSRICWSRHMRLRMVERGITTRQVLTLLKSKHSVFQEGPYRELNGDWKFNLKGLTAGQIITLSVVLKNHHDSPRSVLVTVWIN